jgi:hypothetical protein
MRRSREPVMSVSVSATCSGRFSSASSKPALPLGWSVGERFGLMRDCTARDVLTRVHWSTDWLLQFAHVPANN